VPEQFRKWGTEDNGRIETANNRGTLPYFLQDNATFAGISVNRMNVTGLEEIITNARKAYSAYDEKVWSKACFDEYSGGYNVYHKNHQFTKKGGGGKAEIRSRRNACKI